MPSARICAPSKLHARASRARSPTSSAEASPQPACRHQLRQRRRCCLAWRVLEAALGAASTCWSWTRRATTIACSRLTRLCGGRHGASSSSRSTCLLIASPTSLAICGAMATSASRYFARSSSRGRTAPLTAQDEAARALGSMCVPKHTTTFTIHQSQEGISMESGRLAHDLACLTKRGPLDDSSRKPICARLLVLL